MNFQTKYFIGYINTNPNLPKASLSTQIYTIGKDQFPDLNSALSYKEQLEEDPSNKWYEYDVFKLEKVT